jgi:hypothetical protein
MSLTDPRIQLFNIAEEAWRWLGLDSGRLEQAKDARNEKAEGGQEETCGEAPSAEMEPRIA